MTQSSHSQARGTAFGLLTALAVSITTSLSLVSAQAAVTDVQINALVSQAINTHPLVGSARAEQQATMEGVTAAKLNLLPTPNVSMGYDKDDDFVSQFVVRQPIWTAGRLTANVNQAVFDDKAAIEYVYEQQNEVAKITIDAWQSYINAVARQRVSIDSLKTLNEFEQMMQRRVAQGVSARIELNLASNRILQEQNAYQAAAEQQRIAAARLEQIIGEPIPQQTALSVPDLGLLVRQVKQQSVPFERMAFNQASFYNPTVVREAYQVESAKQELEAQQSALFPNVYAQYEHTYYQDENNNDGRFSIGLDYTPGAGFSSLALSRASGARVDSLIESREAARRSVMEDIQVKYQQFASAKNRELSLEAAVAGAQIVVDSYRRQFIAGRKSWTEVLNAVRELNDYQTQLAQTRSEILGSFYKLQVDFGLMPWQKFANERNPVKLFQPYNSVQDWLEQRSRKVQLRDAGLLMPTATNSEALLQPSTVSFSDAENIESYHQADIIDYDRLSTGSSSMPKLTPYRLQTPATNNTNPTQSETHDVVEEMQNYSDDQAALSTAKKQNTTTAVVTDSEIIIPLGATSLTDYLPSSLLSNQLSSNQVLATKPINKAVNNSANDQNSATVTANTQLVDGVALEQQIIAKEAIIQEQLNQEQLRQENIKQQKQAEQDSLQQKQQQQIKEQQIREQLREQQEQQEQKQREQAEQTRLEPAPLAEDKVEEESLQQAEQGKLAQLPINQDNALNNNDVTENDAIGNVIESDKIESDVTRNDTIENNVATDKNNQKSNISNDISDNSADEVTDSIDNSDNQAKTDAQRINVVDSYVVDPKADLTANDEVLLTAKPYASFIQYGYTE